MSDEPRPPMDEAEFADTDQPAIGGTPPTSAPEPAGSPLDDALAYQAARSVSPWMYVFLVGLAGLVIGLIWITVEQVGLGSSPALIGWFFVSLACVLAPVAWHAVDVLNGLKGSSQRAQAGLFVALTVVLGAVVFVAISGLNMSELRDLPALDFTENRKFTTDPESTAVLDEAGGEVFLTYLVFRGTQPLLRQRALEQLKTYTRVSDRVKVRQFTPFRDKEAAESHLRSVGVPELDFDATQDLLIVSYAEAGKEVAAGKYKEIPVDPTTWTQTNALGEQTWLGERLITSAVRELAFDDRKLYFTGGHGEVSLRQGYTRLRNRLVGQNLTLESAPLDLARTSRVPADCDVLVIANPQTTFSPEEVDRVRAFLDDGGELMLFVDARLNAEPLGLEALLKEHGLTINPGFNVIAPVIDQGSTTGQIDVRHLPHFPVGVQEYSNHPAVRSLRAQQGLRLFFVAPSFVDVAEDPEPGIDAVGVVHAPEYPVQQVWPWAMRLDGTVREGIGQPIAGKDVQARRLNLAATSTRTLAPAADGTARDTRIVVLSDMDSFHDEVIAQGAQPNLDLTIGLFQWLLEREGLVSISGATMSAEAIQLTPRGRRLAKFWPLVTVVLPLLVGAGVWWARRR